MPKTKLRSVSTDITDSHCCRARAADYAFLFRKHCNGSYSPALEPVSCNLMSTVAMDLAPPELIAKYEPVIGLEVHVQLGTRTKIFCGCPTGFGALPNTNVCPVCLGLPGALPVLSREAVELAMKAAMALKCEIAPVSRFA